MLFARSLFLQIHDHDEAFRLLCSISAAGEEHGGWENERIASLVDDPELAYKISRHGADEDKHGRIFRGLLNKRGLEEVSFPEELDYMRQLERQGIGVAHSALRRGEPLGADDVVDYLVHSRVTEQRAVDELRLMRTALAERPDMLRVLTVIGRDEDTHLAYAHEELLRLARGDRERAVLIRRQLRRTALVEIRVHRDVSLAVMSRMGGILGWSKVRGRLLSWAIRATYVYERWGGWRRMTRLKMPAPELRNALGRPARVERA
ncbi:ferritin-like domain-containing protein [Streptomyces gobiensis]|uniref:ferritin-like domain-containing protein n=1 Tax=Streptomyces gobiensis TaxID=2875706 RepID=UPI001E357D6E|nr:ferritin-like domain-containing protein [Streptomyces gobiensis]UGY91121.1 ferritin-like domain-containing protein [Streptomyces gobiensis]